ncbi:MAG: ribosomal protein [Pseudonocardia sp.]|nr:ribosomal protein [Pseudonocardia sp.]
MAVKIKLMRLGKIRQPYYRIVIEVNSERAQYWLGVGAQPTDSVRHLLEVTGDWQRFKGLPGAEGTLKPQPEKVDKLARFQAALAAANDEPTTEATTPRRRRPRADEAPEGTAAAEAPAES